MRAGFHQVLAVEMRPPGIGDRGGMEDRSRTFLPTFVECLQPRMQVEVGCQFLCALDDDVGPRPFHGLVARLHSRQPVHAATQHDDHKVPL